MRHVVAVLVALLALEGCAAMSPEALAAQAKDKNAIIACGQGTGPWGKVVTVFVDANKINDNNSVTVEGECKITVTGTKQAKDAPK